MIVLGGGNGGESALQPGSDGFDYLADAQHFHAHRQAGGQISDPGSDWVDVGAESLDAALQSVLSTITAGLAQLGGQVSALQRQVSAQSQAGPILTSKNKVMLVAGIVLGGLTLAGGAIYGAYRVAEYVVNETVERLSLAYDNTFQNQLGQNQTPTRYIQGPGHHHPSNDLAVYTSPEKSDPQEKRAVYLAKQEEKRQRREGL